MIETTLHHLCIIYTVIYVWSYGYIYVHILMHNLWRLLICWLHILTLMYEAHIMWWISCDRSARLHGLPEKVLKEISGCEVQWTQRTIQVGVVLPTDFWCHGTWLVMLEVGPCGNLVCIFLGFWFAQVFLISMKAFSSYNNYGWLRFYIHLGHWNLQPTTDITGWMNGWCRCCWLPSCFLTSNSMMLTTSIIYVNRYQFDLRWESSRMDLMPSLGSLGE